MITDKTLLRARAATRHQFLHSGFVDRDYRFIKYEGTFDGTLVFKRWCKGCKLIAYFDMADVQTILTCAWVDKDYMGLADIPIGAKLRLTFKNSKRDNIPFLRDVEIITLPGGDLG